MRYVYLGCILYGFTTCIAILANICIMFQYGSTISLGAITSIIAVATMIIILLIGKFTHAGKRTWLFVVSACLPFIGSLSFVIWTSKVTLIIYNVCIAVANAVYATIFDIYRNGNLKELNLYSEITEHQALAEMCFCFSRIISFGTIMLLGMLGNMTSFYVALVVFTLFASAMLIYLLVYEKKYLKTNANLVEKKQNNVIIDGGENNGNN